jgi:hypothetical protein
MPKTSDPSFHKNRIESSKNTKTKKIDQEAEEEFKDDIQRFSRQQKNTGSGLEDTRHGKNSKNKNQEDLEMIYGEDISREQLELDLKLKNDRGVDL